MRLTTFEQRMLNGEFGDLKQQALSKTIDYAHIVQAEELCEVTMAHLFCGAHPYLDAVPSRDFDSVYAEMAFCGRKPLIFTGTEPLCRCQADVFPISSHNWAAMTDEQSRVRLNEEYLKRFTALGVRLVGTCVPYMTGFIPLPGEHYVSSESHAVLLMNSLWGACGQADGLEAGFWAAVCGRTPLWGLHDLRRRRGTHLFRLETELKTLHDWDLFGHAAGLKIPPQAIPVFLEGFSRPDIHKFKAAAAAMATTSGAEMVHFVGLTPEAPTLEAALADNASREVTIIDERDLAASRSLLSCGRRIPVDYVSVGCPHLSIHQLGEVASFLENKRVSANTVAHVWTAAPFKEVADRAGYTAIIEASGAQLLTNSCPLVSGRRPADARSLALDSAKQAHYLKSETDQEILYGSWQDCLNSAFSGVWEGATG